MRFLQWLLGGATVFALLYIISINAQKTAFYWTPNGGTQDLPIYMVIIAAFGAGYFIGLFYYWLGTFPKYLAHQKEKRLLERRIEDLENELDEEE
ncbi:MAG: hypothetical protein CL570_04105 [Alphaproteobacteria bacterium]|nr:hypothetical protein [Alphaproteobacteria bacterium]|tara:strand:- start:26648 stop:26932 length:285 start_codon:yes stop_codon:yes gene_type:complete